MPRQAQVRKHKASGQYILRQRGRVHYLGHDREAAERRACVILGRAAQHPEQARRDAQRAADGLTVEQAIERLLPLIGANVRNPAGLRQRLRPFSLRYGSHPIGSITLEDVLQYRADLLSQYASVTALNHLVHAQRLLKMSASLGWRQPLDMTAIPKIPQPTPKAKGWSPDELRSFMGKLWNNAYAQPWARLQFLAALRPSEVWRMVNGEAEKQDEGHYILPEHKTSSRTKQPRFIVLSDEAKSALADCRPKYTHPNAYGQACRRATGKSPHALRHTAATAMLRAGVDRSTVDIVLGHSVPSVSWVYMPEHDLAKMREAVGHLPALLREPKAREA